MPRVALVPLVLVLALAAPVHADEAFDTARARWRAASLADYEYGYRKYCDCYRDTPPETRIRVRGTTVVDVRLLGPDSDLPVAAESFRDYWTVDELFALVERASRRGATVRATYDATLGHPTAIFVDYDTAQIGDELDLRELKVTALPR